MTTHSAIRKALPLAALIVAALFTLTSVGIVAVSYTHLTLPTTPYV